MTSGYAYYHSTLTFSPVEHSATAGLYTGWGKQGNA